MFFLPVAMIMIACTKTATVDTVPDAVNKTKMLQLVNNVRKSGCKCGDTWYYPAPALTWNDKLESISIAHSQDMYDKKYFNHTAPDGADAGVRMDRAGYKWKAYGENIATGHRSEEEVIKGWLSSPGHCRNIMNKDYKEMGVGRKGSLWTQTFGTR